MPESVAALKRVATKFQKDNLQNITRIESEYKLESDIGKISKRIQNEKLAIALEPVQPRL